MNKGNNFYKRKLVAKNVGFKVPQRSQLSKCKSGHFATNIRTETPHEYSCKAKSNSCYPSKTLGLSLSLFIPSHSQSQFSVLRSSYKLTFTKFYHYPFEVIRLRSCLGSEISSNFLPLK